MMESYIAQTQSMLATHVIMKSNLNQSPQSYEHAMKSGLCKTTHTVQSTAFHKQLEHNGPQINPHMSREELSGFKTSKSTYIL